MRNSLLIAALGLLSLLSQSAQAKPPVETCPEVTTSASKAEALEGPLDLNRATESDLEKLPGIGKTRALAILAFRDAHGGFSNVAQLMRIKGIGRAMLKKLAPLVTVSPRPAEPSAKGQKGGNAVR